MPPKKRVVVWSPAIAAALVSCPTPEDGVPAVTVPLVPEPAPKKRVRKAPAPAVDTTDTVQRITAKAKALFPNAEVTVIADKATMGSARTLGAPNGWFVVECRADNRVVGKGVHIKLDRAEKGCETALEVSASRG